MKWLYSFFILIMLYFLITNPSFVILIIITTLVVSIMFFLCYLRIKEDKENRLLAQETQEAFEKDELKFDFMDRFGESAQNKLDKFNDISYEAEEVFSEIFSIKQRILILKKALQAFDDFKAYCHSKGCGGILYFAEEAEYYLDSTYSFTPYKRDLNDGDYTPEFDRANFSKIHFLEELLYEYENNSDAVKKHLHDEEVYYHGGQEEYDLMMYEQNLNKNILMVLRKNNGILQTSFYELFDESLKFRIRKELQSLESKSLIIRQKAGSTYKLTIPDKNKVELNAKKKEQD